MPPAHLSHQGKIMLSFNLLPWHKNLIILIIFTFHPHPQPQIFPDYFVKREVMAHEVFCQTKRQHGCTWKGALGKLQVHVHVCVHLHFILDIIYNVTEKIRILPMEGFLVWIPPLFSEAPYFPLKILAFQNPQPYRIFNDLPWGRYGYFLELHNAMCMFNNIVTTSTTLQF